MSRRKSKVTPFNYGHWKAASTAIQVATAVGGVIAAVFGEPAGLLGLGALFGGSEGSILGDVRNQILREVGVPVGTKEEGK